MVGTAQEVFIQGPDKPALCGLEARHENFYMPEGKMKEAITLITPSGDRPLAFALCQNWMRKQTLQPYQWIVIDDGKIPVRPYVLMEYVRREPQANDPQCTLILNLMTTLPLIEGNKIIIIEDDEYYAPRYVEEMAIQLDQHEVVGIGNTRYYHLFSGKHYRHRNRDRASLAQTAFRDSFLPEFKKILNTNIEIARIDSYIWGKLRGDNRGFIFVEDENDPLYVGIKGLPGRPGIIGHDSKSSPYQRGRPDIYHEVLAQWIPEDYNIYVDIIKGKLTEDNCE